MGLKKCVLKALINAECNVFKQILLLIFCLMTYFKWKFKKLYHGNNMTYFKSKLSQNKISQNEKSQNEIFQNEISQDKIDISRCIVYFVYFRIYFVIRIICLRYSVFSLFKLKTHQMTVISWPSTHSVLFPTNWRHVELTTQKVKYLYYLLKDSANQRLRRPRTML